MQFLPPDQTIRRGIAAYLFVLAVIAGFVTAANGVTNRILRRQQMTARVVNLSGRQRMLSQRIALLGMELAAHSNITSEAETRKELVACITRMNASRELLRHGALPPMDRLEPLLLSLAGRTSTTNNPDPHVLDGQLSEFLRHAQAIAARPTRELGIADSDLVAVQLGSRGPLLRALDAAVLGYQTQSESSLYGLRVLLIWITGALLVVLVAQHFLLFRPLLLRLVRDMAERKQERALRDQLAAIVDSSDAAIMAIDLQGTITAWNRSAENVYGYLASEVVGQPVRMLLSPEQAGEESGIMMRIQNGESVEQLETVRVRKDHTKIDVSLTISPVRDASGTIVGASKITHEITERKRVEQALRDQERNLAREKVKVAEASSQAKSEFVAHMSHELRTPLNGIIGMTDLTLDTELSAEQKDYLQTIKLSADSLLSVINDILDFSKIEAGKVELEEVAFDLNVCIEDTLKTLAMRAHEKRLELFCEVAAGVPETVMGDPGRLRQVLNNLIGNALKFTEAGEIGLRVTAEQDLPFLQFTVSDSGVGIAPQKLRLIFDSFTQADASTTRQFGGTGLGLSISRGLVEMMGGRIWVESEIGGGSRFHFTVRFGKATLPPAVIERAAAAATLQGLKALIVDDNGTNRRILHTMVERWGMKATSVSDGEQALCELSAAEEINDAYGLILTDMHMPKMDGFALVKQIRERTTRSTAPIIMLTSGGQRGDVARCAELSIGGYLHKPVRRAELEATITSLLQGKPGSSPPPVVSRYSLREKGGYIKSLHILLAEDNAVNQKVAIRLLEKRGHQVVLATTGEGALAALAERAFDLVLMDVHMPGMDGIQATIQIREQERVSGLHQPVIAMTAMAMKGDYDRCMAAGMDGYLSKPIDLQKLDELLAVYADRRRATVEEKTSRSEDAVVPVVPGE